MEYAQYKLIERITCGFFLEMFQDIMILAFMMLLDNSNILLDCHADTRV